MLDLHATLADNLRKCRIEKGLSQTDLAERTGLRTRRIVNLEKARGSPRVSTIEALARALGVDPAELFTEE
jgi:transcriptional regulator with XRE-family HTH domain